MGIYSLAERAEEKMHEQNLLRAEWVRNRAEEMKKEWPMELPDLVNPFISWPSGICLDYAQEAYAEMVDSICMQRAELEMKHKEILGEF